MGEETSHILQAITDMGKNVVDTSKQHAGVNCTVVIQLPHDVRLFT